MKGREALLVIRHRGMGRTSSPIPLTKNASRPRAARGGFTLLEVMIAVVILAVAATIVWSTFTVTVKAYERGTDMADRDSLRDALMHCYGAEAGGPLDCDWIVAQQAFRLVAGQLDQIAIEFEIGVAQQRHAALAAADELAGAAQVQVLPRDLEAVRVLEDDLQSRPRRFGERPGIKQCADRLVRAATDAAAQLVQL